MRAVQVTRLDGPEAVEVLDVPEPEPTPDALLVDVEAAGLAFPEVLMSRGQYQIKPAIPFTLGAEVGGVVRVAPEGSGFAPGDRIAGLCFNGGFAETALVPLTSAFKLPDNITTEQGAGLLFNDLTVHFVLRKRARLAPGESVLVHGAAGGIGVSVLRLAPALGAARVIAVVSDERKAEVARSLGASDVVMADGFLAAVKDATGGEGVDIVVDPVGGDRFTDSLRSLRPEGRLAVVGFTAGEIPTVAVNRLLLNNIDVVGAGWGMWFLSHPGYLQSQWAELEPLLAAGTIPPLPLTAYPLERAAEAMLAMDRREVTGKVVIRP
ncbi:MAG TPA: NADPH:quinone oxidoreductase family protein [Mycobacteriales bacterium]|nr:NADPH:quinone oxidoreductase family protein [Mycobacteriales bacterium]